MTKLITLIYGISAYLLGMGGLTFFILFIGGWDFMPIHIDSGIAGNTAVALIVNTLLIVLFAVHHTMAARPSFKKKWQHLIPHSVERSTYVLFSGLFLTIICLFWQPLYGMVWDFSNEFIQTSLIVIQIIGWSMVVIASFMINHFELFGLQRSYCFFMGKDEPEASFTDRGLYKIVRHPIQLGVLIGIWSTPTMSVSHLMLSLFMTNYIFIGLYYEERDLIQFLGDEYQDYQNRVHKLLPIPKKAE